MSGMSHALIQATRVRKVMSTLPAPWLRKPLTARRWPNTHCIIREPYIYWMIIDNLPKTGKRGENNYVWASNLRYCLRPCDIYGQAAPPPADILGTVTSSGTKLFGTPSGYQSISTSTVEYTSAPFVQCSCVPSLPRDLAYTHRTECFKHYAHREREKQKKRDRVAIYQRLSFSFSAYPNTAPSPTRPPLLPPPPAARNQPALNLCFLRDVPTWEVLKA